MEVCLEELRVGVGKVASKAVALVGRLGMVALEAAKVVALMAEVTGVVVLVAGAMVPS